MFGFLMITKFSSKGNSVFQLICLGQSVCVCVLPHAFGRVGGGHAAENKL